LNVRSNFDAYKFTPNMPTIINHTRYLTLPPEWALAQRALYYGDALFESMRLSEGVVPLLQNHVARLLSGLKQIGVEVPAHWDTAFFGEQIAALGLTHGRIRLMVWRSTGGLYLPTDHGAQFLLHLEATEQGGWLGAPARLRVTVARRVQLPTDAYSGLKSFNTARYVQAAREAQERGFDDALLLNAHEQVAEATASNLFWCKQGVWHTTPLSSGCVAGVMRQWLMTALQQQGLPVREQTVTAPELLEADAMVLSNAVRGLMPVGTFETRHFHAGAADSLLPLLPLFQP
jgi:branched-chain amino acid aminotransferase